MYLCCFFPFSEHAIKERKLKGQAAVDFKAQYVYIFKKFLLGSSEKETEESLLERWVTQYNENKTKFQELVREINTIYVRITDVNGDGSVSREEHKAQLAAMGLDSFDEKFFNAFPKNDDGAIPNELLVDGACEYYCNSDETNVSLLEKATCYGFRMLDDI